MHIAHGLQQGQVGPGQRSVGQRQPSVAAQDLAVVQGEAGDIRAASRHRVGHQKHLCRAAVSGKCGADHGRMYMHPVGNQAGCHARMIKRRPHQPRTARVGLAHGVEQMRCHAGTGVKGAHGGVIVAITMAQRH